MNCGIQMKDLGTVSSGANKIEGQFVHRVNFGFYKALLVFKNTTKNAAGTTQ